MLRGLRLHTGFSLASVRSLRNHGDIFRQHELPGGNQILRASIAAGILDHRENLPIDDVPAHKRNPRFSREPFTLSHLAVLGILFGGSAKVARDADQFFLHCSYSSTVNTSFPS